MKRVPFLKERLAQRVSLQTWLSIHIYTGIVGALLALVHTGHKYTSPLGIAVTATMLLVVVSGIVLRYLTPFVNLEVKDKLLLLQTARGDLDHAWGIAEQPADGKESRPKEPAVYTAERVILQRQPTAFHADVAACAACHQEHQGRVLSTTDMDHVALARIGLRQIQPAAKSRDPARDDLIAWIANGTPSAATPQLQREESLLNCATCHQTKDRHFGLFGNDCAQCHGTAKWTVPEFRHPSPVSQSCAQCHQAPPSHYMMHFKMISMSIARMEKAEVSQCFLCHQTTSWNDIKGAGWYKHH